MPVHTIVTAIIRIFNLEYKLSSQNKSLSALKAKSDHGRIGNVGEGPNTNGNTPVPRNFMMNVYRNNVVEEKIVHFLTSIHLFAGATGTEI